MDLLRHSHLLRYVGVHIRQELLSIVTYPAVNMSLTVYLDMLDNRNGNFSSPPVNGSLSSLKKFLPCLASALKYLQVQAGAYTSFPKTCTWQPYFHQMIIARESIFQIARYREP
jgi:hypothetical protein